MLTIVIIILLTVMSISLKIAASGLDLSSKIHSRLSSKSDKKGKYKIVNEVVKFGLTTSVRFMRFLSFILARVRDMISIVGSAALLWGLVIFLALNASVISSLSLFTNTNEEGNLIFELYSSTENNENEVNSTSDEESKKETTESDFEEETNDSETVVLESVSLETE